MKQYLYSLDNTLFLLEQPCYFDGQKMPWGMKSFNSGARLQYI